MELELNRVGVYNETRRLINKFFIKKMAIKVLDAEGKDNCECNIIIVNDEYMKALNHKHRKIDKSTDVLSFAFNEVNSNSPYPFEVLGDIYISYDKVKSQSIDYRHTRKRELSFLIVHGMYHLLGYDHQNERDKKKMREKERMILDGSKETRRE